VCVCVCVAAGGGVCVVRGEREREIKREKGRELELELLLELIVTTAWAFDRLVVTLFLFLSLLPLQQLIRQLRSALLAFQCQPLLGGSQHLCLELQ
jgi:hypothetical protein